MKRTILATATAMFLVIGCKDMKLDIQESQERIGELEENFVSRIQSLKYIPEYSDGKVEVSDMLWTLSLDFLVSPSEQAVQVQKAWEAAGETVTAYLRTTKSPDTRAVGAAIPLSITSVTGTADGVLNVVIGPIDDAYLSGNDNAAVAYINISDGNSNIFSDMVDIAFHPLIRNQNLSKSADGQLQTANCYIVSEAGLYYFKTVKGNGSESVGTIASADVIWESFGTDVEPSVGDLIKSVSYSGGYIGFRTADTFKEGNAVLAAKDADGNILWSWHIWFTDQPQGQEYKNNAGTMMDRNLGATSATPGDVGALGLLYQWGRKDPFLGSSSISESVEAKSTITWPSVVESNSSNGTIEYAIAHPTTFIACNDNNWDWYYTGSSSADNTRWTTSETAKSIYDPCPAGWRVPDGGSNGVWSKALGSSSYFSDDSLYGSTNEGMNFSGKFGSASTIWYPASGCRGDYNGSLYGVGYRGSYWSASPSGNNAYSLYFDYNGSVDPSSNDGRAYGQSVRCIKVIDEVAEP